MSADAEFDSFSSLNSQRTIFLFLKGVQHYIMHIQFCFTLQLIAIEY